MFLSLSKYFPPSHEIRSKKQKSHYYIDLKCRLVYRAYHVVPLYTVVVDFSGLMLIRHKTYIYT